MDAERKVLRLPAHGILPVTCIGHVRVSSHLHRDWALPCHICTGTGLTPAHTSAELSAGQVLLAVTQLDKLATDLPSSHASWSAGFKEDLRGAAQRQSFPRWMLHECCTRAALTKLTLCEEMRMFLTALSKSVGRLMEAELNAQLTSSRRAWAQAAAQAH